MNKTSTTPRILLFLLASLPFSIPYHVLPQTSYHVEAVAFFISLYFILLSLFANEILIDKKIIGLIIFIALLIWQQAYHALPYLLLFLGLLATAWGQAWTLRSIALGCVFGSILNSILVCFQFSTDLPLFGALAQKGHLTTYLIIGAASAFYLRWTSLAFFFIAVAYLVGQRTIALYLLLFLFIYLILFWTRYWKLWTPLLLILLLVGYNLLGIDQTRLFLWQQAWSFFLSSPLLGIGFGQFAVETKEGIAFHSHSLPLNLLAETGILGFSCILGNLFLWIGLSKLRSDMEYIYALCVCSILGIHSMLEFPLWYAYFLAILAIVIGSLQQNNKG